MPNCQVLSAARLPNAGCTGLSMSMDDRPSRAFFVRADSGHVHEGVTQMLPADPAPKRSADLLSRLYPENQLEHIGGITWYMMYCHV